METLKLRLTRMILSTIESGADTFITGCQAGFDILAAEHVVTLRGVYPHIRSFCVAPFSLGFFKPKWWTRDWRRRAVEVYSASDFTISLHEREEYGSYHERNRLMVDCSAKVIAYCPQIKGGTWYTVTYAAGHGIPVINLYDM